MSLLDDLDGSIEEEKSLAVKKDPFVEELYFATYKHGYYGESRGKVWRLREDKTPDLIFTNCYAIASLCSHERDIYAAGDFNGIINISDVVNDYDERMIDRKNCVNLRNFSSVGRSRKHNSLCSHDGELYCMSTYVHSNSNYQWEYDIYVANHGERCENVALRYNDRVTLCSHKGKLYDATDCKLFDTLNDPNGENPIYDPNDHFPSGIGPSWTLWELCSHMRTLYARRENVVFDILNDPKAKFSHEIRSPRIGALCSHKGKLLGSSSNGDAKLIKDLLNDEVICQGDEGWSITAMCSHKRRPEA